MSNVFDLEKVPTDCSSNESTVYCNDEVEFLCEYYFGTDNEKKNEFMNEWDSFEFELISVRKKWFQLKENLSRNKLKPDINATEWFLKQICMANKIDEYPIITSIAEIAFIIRGSNAWPEQIGSAIKRIKINKRSTLKSDALNALIMISTNDPKCETPEASYLIKQTSILFGEHKNDTKKHRQYKEKRPPRKHRSQELTLKYYMQNRSPKLI